VKGESPVTKKERKNSQDGGEVITKGFRNQMIAGSRRDYKKMEMKFSPPAGREREYVAAERKQGKKGGFKKTGSNLRVPDPCPMQNKGRGGNESVLGKKRVESERYRREALVGRGKGTKSITKRRANTSTGGRRGNTGREARKQLTDEVTTVAISRGFVGPLKGVQFHPRSKGRARVKINGAPSGRSSAVFD